MKFSEILDNNGLTQVVEEPTRKNNILDLLITNQPSQVLGVDVIHGVSDHDVVFAELDLRPVQYEQKPRQIPLYKKANWDLIRADMSLLKSTISTMHETASVNDMWILFRDTLQSSITSNISYRQSKTKYGYPWIGPELKRLMRKQHRYYKTKKKTGDPQHIQQYVELKHLVQKRTRQAYWNYVEEIVRLREHEAEHISMKRFWTYITHKRNDNVRVSSLKNEGKLFSQLSC